MARTMVIIGGDAAGMTAAAQARRMKTADELDIVVFERTTKTSYAACGLPYLVGGFVASPDSLIARAPAQHRANGIDVRIRHEVTAIDVKAGAVIVRDLDAGLESSLHFDELLIATGASGVSPPWPGIDAKGVLQLRTLDDAAEVERLITAGARRAVVVGFLDPQIMVGLVGKPEVKAVADAAEQRLRRACLSLGGSSVTSV